jgi:hypothetical protein
MAFVLCNHLQNPKHCCVAPKPGPTEKCFCIAKDGDDVQLRIKNVHTKPAGRLVRRPDLAKPEVEAVYDLVHDENSNAQSGVLEGEWIRIKPGQNVTFILRHMVGNALEETTITMIQPEGC